MTLIRCNPTTTLCTKPTLPSKVKKPYIFTDVQRMFKWLGIKSTYTLGKLWIDQLPADCTQNKMCLHIDEQNNYLVINFTKHNQDNTTSVFNFQTPIRTAHQLLHKLCVTLSVFPTEYLQAYVSTKEYMNGNHNRKKEAEQVKANLKALRTKKQRR